MNKVSINCDSASLEGDLSISKDAKGIVIFAHGSGSSRYSPRNRYVVRTLHNNGLATLLFDLLTKEEEDENRWTGHLRFNILLLATRLINITDWLKKSQQTGNLKIGYFWSQYWRCSSFSCCSKANYCCSSGCIKGRLSGFGRS